MLCAPLGQTFLKKAFLRELSWTNTLVPLPGRSSSTFCGVCNELALCRINNQDPYLWRWHAWQRVGRRAVGRPRARPRCLCHCKISTRGAAGGAPAVQGVEATDPRRHCENHRVQATLLYLKLSKSLTIVHFLTAWEVNSFMRESNEQKLTWSLHRASPGPHCLHAVPPPLH